MGFGVCSNGLGSAQGSRTFPCCLRAIEAVCRAAKPRRWEVALALLESAGSFQVLRATRNHYTNAREVADHDGGSTIGVYMGYRGYLGFTV